MFFFGQRFLGCHRFVSQFQKAARNISVSFSSHKVCMSVSKVKGAGINAGVCDKNMPFMKAFAPQSRSRNCSPALDLVLCKLLFQWILFFLGVFFSQMPVSQYKPQCGETERWLVEAVVVHLTVTPAQTRVRPLRAVRTRMTNILRVEDLEG